jgi:TonB family protein
MIRYAHDDGDHFRYELLSPSGNGPGVHTLVAPYFPDELLTQRTSGEVVIDIQVTDRGDVAGIWLISAQPEVFADLATAAVHDWKFTPTPAKIRVTMRFIP